MQISYFELLLAMMRLLKRSKEHDNYLDFSIASFIDSFYQQLTPQQQRVINNQFNRYVLLIEKQKKRYEEEEYKLIIENFLQEEMN